jgi:hypothetical protein
LTSYPLLARQIILAVDGIRERLAFGSIAGVSFNISRQCNLEHTAAGANVLNMLVRLEAGPN